MLSLVSVSNLSQINYFNVNGCVDANEQPLAVALKAGIGRACGGRGFPPPPPPGGLRLFRLRCTQAAFLAPAYMGAGGSPIIRCPRVLQLPTPTLVAVRPARRRLPAAGGDQLWIEARRGSIQRPLAAALISFFVSTLRFSP